MSAVHPYRDADLAGDDPARYAWRVGARQYVITGPAPQDLPEGYSSIELDGDRVLHHCPLLPLGTGIGPEGRRRALLGLVHAPEGADPGLQLQTLPAEELRTATRAWAGRWILVDGDEIIQDPGGYLSVFRAQDGSVAGTPALLRATGAARHGFHEDLAMPFMPGPDTGLDGITRVLPGQVLSLSRGSTEPRPLVDSRPCAPARVEEVLEEAGQVLLTAVSRAAEHGDLVLPLTAGHDSRLLLAACVRLGLRPRTLTQAFPGMATADRALPPVMAERVGLEHTLVRPGPRDPARGELYDRQVAGLIRERDRTFMVHGQFDGIRPGDVLLRATEFDGTRGALHAVLDEIDDTVTASRLGELFGATAAQEEALGRWLALVRADPTPIPFHDRFWIEQKVASYAATTELALDLTGAHSALVGNSARYQELARSLPADRRLASWHHEELVRRWAPAVADLPYNPPRTARDRAWRVVGALRRRGRRLRARLRRSHI